MEPRLGDLVRADSGPAVDPAVNRFHEPGAPSHGAPGPSTGARSSARPGDSLGGASPPGEPDEDVLLVVGERNGNDQTVLAAAARAGFEVVHAADCAEARDAVGTAYPILAIVDHRLPDGDGVELIKELRESRPGCETILVTSGGNVEDAIEILRAGALDCLCPPIDANRLQIAFGRARDRRRFRRAPDAFAILVIEDHDATRKRLCRVLAKEGYEVAGAGNGEEGMRLLRERRFDLIVTDVKMPVKNGIEVLRETKGAGLDVEAIVITGHGDEELVTQALRDGAVNFLRKPIDIEHMLLAVEKALEYRTVQRSLAYRNREMERMRDLVVRLTQRRDLIVEAPYNMSDDAQEFLRQLVDALSVGIVVAGPAREILYANHQVVTKTGTTPETLSADWLKQLGLLAITEENLHSSFVRAANAEPGTLDRLKLSQWSYLVMTPLTLVRPGGAARCVAVVIRGERAPQRESGSGGA